MRPFELLPFPFPCDFDPGEEEPDFFYKNFVKPMIPDMIQMMDAGLTIDSEAVDKLRIVIDDVQETVYERLNKNLLIQTYQLQCKPAAQKAHAEKATQAVRSAADYLKEFNEKDVLHRTWVVNSHLKAIGRDKDIRDKWTLKDLKTYNIFLNDPILDRVINKLVKPGNAHVLLAMRELAEHKAELWNRPRYEKAEEEVELAPFNPNSALQVAGLFRMLDIMPRAFSKDTGGASWGRDQLVELQKEGQSEELNEVLEALIDNSFSAIIKNNFIKAFDSYTIDGVLHGNIQIFGAKSFRPTSNSPNLLNAPSSRSIYAKPLKRCFIASDKDRVILTADLGALEDRVIANLSGDVNKGNVFLEGLDGHSLNACGYFPAKIADHMGKNTDNVSYVKEFKRLVDEGNKHLDKIRFESKAPTFKLAYGGYPDADKGGVITQEIFDNYHNVLYPSITQYREEYVLPTAQEQGYLHLGLGCRLYTNDPGQQIRTLHNATVQFWSILTLIAVNELNHRMKVEGIENEVKVISTIYDSIYTDCSMDPEIIQWVNNNLIDCMTVQYLEEERISNTAQAEIGLNWADLHKIPNNASLGEIEEVLDGL